MQCFKCLYVVRVVTTPPDNDAIRNRRQYEQSTQYGQSTLYVLRMVLKENSIRRTEIIQVSIMLFLKGGQIANCVN